ncbi:nuclear transport factor 2 family protein [Glycomyces luteolus]|uniref:Nuclear transport factor 2 family protein n=1 Tax=Glycomyces luteolus TaxID=2670330 RepID=A0A9X3SRC4_9ACTN|nr:nuclear transport factor 2 family protein [Glycomyces luteolus]MDA1361211.1 nuclear transport factor 2 family protein [Glycomyces luteolus]
MTESTAAVAQLYIDAMASGEPSALAALFADDLVWHQPGRNRFSGDKHGGGAVGEMIGAMMGVSGGTFALAPNGAPMINGDLAALPIRFSGKRDGAEMSMDGVDLLRVANGKVAEVWLFSADQIAEDVFWGQG